MNDDKFLDYTNYPLKTDLEVLPADEIRPSTVNWTIKEYTGTEVFRFGTEITLTNKDDLKIGDEIDCWGCRAMVISLESNLEHAESDHSLFTLEFDKDDRHCWVCDGVINKRGIARARKDVVIK
jgi:hypothetical protein